MEVWGVKDIELETCLKQLFFWYFPQICRRSFVPKLRQKWIWTKSIHILLFSTSGQRVPFFRHKNLQNYIKH